MLYFYLFFEIKFALFFKIIRWLKHPILYEKLTDLQEFKIDAVRLIERASHCGSNFRNLPLPTGG